MIPWVLLDAAKIPGYGGELRLKKRGAEFSIMLGSNELMNSPSVVPRRRLPD